MTKSPPVRKEASLAFAILLACVFSATAGCKHQAATPPALAPPPPPDVSAGVVLPSAAQHWKEIAAACVGPLRGPANAHYTVVEFGDFEDAGCATARPLIERLVEKHGCNFKLGFINRPSVTDMNSINAAAAACIVAQHGKFWQMYDVLYRHGTALAKAHLPAYAGMAGVSPAVFIHDYKKRNDGGKMAADQKIDDMWNVHTVPSFLLHDNVTGKSTGFSGLKGLQSLISNTPDLESGGAQGVSPPAPNPQ